MPATVKQQSIPVPNNTNIIQVLTALRNVVISQANVDAGRADLTGTVSTDHNPSQFFLTDLVVNLVTYPVKDLNGIQIGTVDIPTVLLAHWVNNVTGQEVHYHAPTSVTSGGTVGAALTSLLIPG